MNKHRQFHITFSPPAKDEQHWPNGFWAVYEINGDQIAKRVAFGPDGEATRRDPWLGYKGGFGSLDEAVQAIRVAMEV
jgi:hypothetical protein